MKMHIFPIAKLIFTYLLKSTSSLKVTIPEVESSNHLSPRSHYTDAIGPDYRSWYQVGKLVARVSGVDKVLSWCQHTVKKSVRAAGQVVWPRTEYRQDLQKILNRVEHLEKELNQLKASKQLEPNVVIHSSLCSPSKCICLQCGKPISNVGTIHNPARTIPPPPPPPPLPPPPPPTQVTNKLMMARSKRKRNSFSEEKKNKVFLVTEEALKSVKLKPRRLTNHSEFDISNSSEPDHGMKRYSLRKSSYSDLEKENITASIAKEVIGFKKTLKKTEIKRSPGGTPIVKRLRKRSSNKGLTAVMSQALQHKFASVNSPESDGSDTSSSNLMDDKSAAVLHNVSSDTKDKMPLKRVQRKSPRLWKVMEVTENFSPALKI